MQRDLPGYISVGARSVSGEVVTDDWIQHTDLTADLTGNKFWDRGPATSTPTLTPTPTATPSFTPLEPTPTRTFTPPEPTPTRTFTPARTATRTPTGTRTEALSTATATWPPTVTRTGAAPTRTATGTITPRASNTFTPTPTATTALPSDCLETLTNGDFELGGLVGWEHSEWVGIAWGHESAHGAHLGGVDGISAELWQTVAITGELDSAHLGFWWLYEGESEQPGDALSVIAQAEEGDVPLLSLPATGPAGVWRYQALSMTRFAGQTVHVTFLAQMDGESPSTFVLDDVSLLVCGAPGEATSTPTGSLTASHTVTTTATPRPTETPTVTWPLPSDCLDFVGNGGFEEGELTSWNSAGAVGLGPGREDERGAWLGGANDASGELLQTVYIPPDGNSLRLAFWWMPESADEQAGDTLSVIIQHGGGADQLLNLQADTRRLWREEVLDLRAYAGQEVTLTFLVHTDGEAPSGFLVDDVAVLACGEAAYPEATWRFSGQVLALGDGEPVRGAQVGLYGAQEPGAPGELLANAQTGRDGGFALVIRDYQEEGFPYFFVGLDDPNHVVLAAEAGLGGVVVGEHQIRFAQPIPREYASNRFFVERGTAEFRPIQPAIVPAWQPMAYYWYDMPPDIDLYIKAIEVTQGIQCLDQSEGYKQCPDNSLELTNGRTTAVRVYVGCNNCPAMVKQLHSLQVELLWAGSKLSLGPGSAVLGGQSAKQTTDVVLTTKLSISRAKGYDVTFILPNPTGMCLSLIATVNGDQKYKEADLTNNDHSLNVPLYNRKPLKISWMSVEYRANGWTGDVWADTKSVGAASSLAAQIYPIPIQYSQWQSWLVYGPHPITGAKCSYCPEVQTDGGAELLKRIGQVYNSGWLVPKPDVLVGWVPWSASGYTEPTWSTNWKWAWAHNPDGIPFAHLIGHLKPMGNLSEQPCAPGTTIGEVGYDALKKAVVSSSTADIMYWGAASMWISPYTWNRMLGKTYTKGWSACGPSSSAIGLGGEGNDPTRREMPARLAQEPLPAILVSGRLEASGGGELDPLYQYASRGPFAIPEPEADYCLEFQNASGELLAGHCFVPLFSDPEDGASRETVPFSFLLPLPEEARRVLLRHGEAVLAERVASAHVPSVSVVAPEPGQVITGTTVISWAGDDEDGDALQYAVLYSANGEASWSPMAFDIEGRALQVESSGWAGGEDARVRVLASDGFHTAAADSAPFGVMRKPPRVSIVAPGDGAVIPLDGAIALEGHAEDLEDGLLGGEALAWWSDRRGRIATGDSWMLPPGALDPGWHEIGLSAVDSDSQEATEVIRVFVGRELRLPLILLNR